MLKDCRLVSTSGKTWFYSAGARTVLYEVSYPFDLEAAVSNLLIFLKFFCGNVLEH